MQFVDHLQYTGKQIVVTLSRHFAFLACSLIYYCCSLNQVFFTPSALLKFNVGIKYRYITGFYYILFLYLPATVHRLSHLVI